MYKATLEQAQVFINALQTRPYKDVFQLVDAIVKSQKDGEGNFLFTVELVQALQGYLSNLPFAEVHEVIQLTGQLQQVEVPQAEAQEGFTEETVAPQTEG
jgi:hypothetical protein